MSGLLRVATKIGRAVGRLHDGGVVHGDLTTSNMILRESDDELVRTPPASHASRPARPTRVTLMRDATLCASRQVLIDFGLSYNTSLAEDKAVDLYVLERAITSAHSTFTGLVRPGCMQRMRARFGARSRMCWVVSLMRVRCTLRHALSQRATRQFEAILEEYRRCSKQWSATLHKFAEGAAHCASLLSLGTM